MFYYIRTVILWLKLQRVGLLFLSSNSDVTCWARCGGKQLAGIPARSASADLLKARLPTTCSKLALPQTKQMNIFNLIWIVPLFAHCARFAVPVPPFRLIKNLILLPQGPCCHDALSAKLIEQAGTKSNAAIWFWYEDDVDSKVRQQTSVFIGLILAAQSGGAKEWRCIVPYLTMLYLILKTHLRMDSSWPWYYSLPNQSVLFLSHRHPSTPFGGLFLIRDVPKTTLQCLKAAVRWTYGGLSRIFSGTTAAQPRSSWPEWAAVCMVVA